MANRQLTVLNPGGYQELLQNGDNLVLDGNLVTGLSGCVSDNDAARKKYVDDEIAGVTPPTPTLQSVLTAGNTATLGISLATTQFSVDAATANTVIGGTLNVSGDITTANDVNARDGSFTRNVTTGGYITATGDVTGNNFIGNGSQLTGLASTLQDVTTNGSTTTTGATFGGALVSNSLAVNSLTEIKSYGTIIATRSSATATDPVQEWNSNHYGNNTTAASITADGHFNTQGNIEITGIDNNGQYNIKPGGEFFKFENTGAWHLNYDDSGSGSGWSYAIDATKDYVRLYGPGTSGSTIVLETKTDGVDVTGDLDVSGAITAPANTSTHTLGGTLEVGGPGGTDNGIIKLSTRPFNITCNSSGIGGSAAAGYTTYNTIIQSVSEDLFVNVGASTVFVVRGSVSSQQGNQGTEELARFTPGAGVELLYNNSKKLETITTGVEVTGDLTVSGEVTADSFDIASLPVLP